MAKDYKYRANPPSPSQRAPGWLWLLAGASVSLFASFLVSLSASDKAQPQVFSSPLASSKKAEEPAQRAEAKEEKSAQGTAERPRAVRPRFQFYAVLPEREFIIPESEVKTRKQQEQLGEQPPSGETYIVQVASFKTAQEAERLQAKLTLLGIPARVETAQIDTVTWYRVRVGPFESIASADKVRSLLREHHFDSVVQVQKAPAATFSTAKSPSSAAQR